MSRFAFFISYILFALCDDTITKKRKTDWFFNNLEKRDETLGKDFDVISSYSFLAYTDNTSCFSPICAELNFHLQLVHHEFEDKYCQYSELQLKSLIKKIRTVNKDILNTANYVYMTAGETKKRLTSDPYGYRFEVYGKEKEEIDDVCEAYRNWMHTATKGMINSKLSRYQLEREARIYVSSVTFKDEWLSKFNPKHSITCDFTLANDVTVKRVFMKKKAYLNHDIVTLNKLSFQIVVVPYKGENLNHIPSRVIVYLIPENNKVSQTDLWNGFYEHSMKAGGIKETILQSKSKEINLYIPKIENLESKLDTLEIFSELFEQRNSKYVVSEMNTYLQIDEQGTKASAVKSSCVADGISHAIQIRANVPHIAFIYDLDLERILFILNDTGLVKKN